MAGPVKSAKIPEIIVLPGTTADEANMKKSPLFEGVDIPWDAVTENAKLGTLEFKSLTPSQKRVLAHNFDLENFGYLGRNPDSGLGKKGYYFSYGAGSPVSPSNGVFLTEAEISLLTESIQVGNKAQIPASITDEGQRLAFFIAIYNLNPGLVVDGPAQTDPKTGRSIRLIRQVSDESFGLVLEVTHKEKTFTIHTPPQMDDFTEDKIDFIKERVNANLKALLKPIRYWDGDGDIYDSKGQLTEDFYYVLENSQFAAQFKPILDEVKKEKKNNQAKEEQQKNLPYLPLANVPLPGAALFAATLPVLKWSSSEPSTEGTQKIKPLENPKIKAAQETYKEFDPEIVVGEAPQGYHAIYLLQNANGAIELDQARSINDFRLGDKWVNLEDTDVEAIKAYVKLAQQKGQITFHNQVYPMGAIKFALAETTYRKGIETTRGIISPIFLVPEFLEGCTSSQHDDPHFVTFDYNLPADYTLAKELINFFDIKEDNVCSITQEVGQPPNTVKLKINTFLQGANWTFEAVKEAQKLIASGDSPSVNGNPLVLTAFNILKRINEIKKIPDDQAFLKACEQFKEDVSKLFVHGVLDTLNDVFSKNIFLSLLFVGTWGGIVGALAQRFLNARLTRKENQSRGAAWDQARFDFELEKAKRELIAPEVLDKFVDDMAPDMVKKAMEGKLEPVYGREDDVRRAFELMLQFGKNSFTLTGDAGLGKTAFLRAMAIEVAKARKGERSLCPPALKDLQFRELNMPKMVGGTRYRGDLEERLVKVTLWLMNDPRNRKLVVDEAFDHLESGKTDGSPGVLTALKDPVGKGEIGAILLMTDDDYEKIRDKQVRRRYPPLEIATLKKSDIRDILKTQLKSQLEWLARNDPALAGFRIIIGETELNHIIDRAPEFFDQADPDRSKDLLNRIVVRTVNERDPQATSIEITKEFIDGFIEKNITHPEIGEYTKAIRGVMRRLRNKSLLTANAIDLPDNIFDSLPHESQAERKKRLIRILHTLDDLAKKVEDKNVGDAEARLAIQNASYLLQQRGVDLRVDPWIDLPEEKKNLVMAEVLSEIDAAIQKIKENTLLNPAVIGLATSHLHDSLHRREGENWYDYNLRLRRFKNKVEELGNKLQTPKDDEEKAQALRETRLLMELGDAQEYEIQKPLRDLLGEIYVLEKKVAELTKAASAREGIAAEELENEKDKAYQSDINDSKHPYFTGTIVDEGEIADLSRKEVRDNYRAWLNESKTELERIQEKIEKSRQLIAEILEIQSRVYARNYQIRNEGARSAGNVASLADARKKAQLRQEAQSYDLAQIPPRQGLPANLATHLGIPSFTSRITEANLEAYVKNLEACKKRSETAEEEALKQYQQEALRLMDPKNGAMRDLPEVKEYNRRARPKGEARKDLPDLSTLPSVVVNQAEINVIRDLRAKAKQGGPLEKLALGYLGIPFEAEATVESKGQALVDYLSLEDQRYGRYGELRQMILAFNNVEGLTDAEKQTLTYEVVAAYASNTQQNLWDLVLDTYGRVYEDPEFNKGGSDLRVELEAELRKQDAMKFLTPETLEALYERLQMRPKNTPPSTILTELRAQLSLDTHYQTTLLIELERAEQTIDGLLALDTNISLRPLREVILLRALQARVNVVAGELNPLDYHVKKELTKARQALKPPASYAEFLKRLGIETAGKKPEAIVRAIEIRLSPVGPLGTQELALIYSAEFQEAKEAVGNFKDTADPRAQIDSSAILLEALRHQCDGTKEYTGKKLSEIAKVVFDKVLEVETQRLDLEDEKKRLSQEVEKERKQRERWTGSRELDIEKQASENIRRRQREEAYDSLDPLEKMACGYFGISSEEWKKTGNDESVLSATQKLYHQHTLLAKAFKKYGRYSDHSKEAAEFLIYDEMLQEEGIDITLRVELTMTWVEGMVRNDKPVILQGSLEKIMIKHAQQEDMRRVLKDMAEVARVRAAEEARRDPAEIFKKAK